MFHPPWLFCHKLVRFSCWQKGIQATYNLSSLLLAAHRGQNRASTNLVRCSCTLLCLRLVARISQPPAMGVQKVSCKRAPSPWSLACVGIKGVESRVSDNFGPSYWMKMKTKEPNLFLLDEKENPKKPIISRGFLKFKIFCFRIEECLTETWRTALHGKHI